MLRLYARRVPYQLLRGSVAAATTATPQGILHITNGPQQKLACRTFSDLADASGYSVKDPDAVAAEGKYEWADVEDFDTEWFDGRDTLHVRFKKTKDSKVFRGLSFYSKEGYWLGALRWNERLRGVKPAVWLHWVNKDPVEIADRLPSAKDGIYTMSVQLTEREFVVMVNGEVLGVRKNMLYQNKNVQRVWFADLEEVDGKFMIEGGFTDESGYSAYAGRPMFKSLSEAWKVYRETSKEHREMLYPDHGWRSEK